MWMSSILILLTANVLLNKFILQELIKISDIKNIVHTCFHCGNTGLLKPIGKTGWKDEDIVEDDCGNVINYTLIEHEDWHVFECPVCHKPVIISEYTFDVANTPTERKTEYPTIAVSPDGVPKEIYSAFESAVKTKGIDHAICLLSLRRVLEMICKDKSAVGRDLEKKIDDLIAKKIFPPMIEDACWIIRQMGNDAAHADKIAVYTYDIEQIIGYVATIIDYLYSLPHRVEKMKIKIEERKKQQKHK